MLLGGLLSRLPKDPVRFAVGVLFVLAVLVGSALTRRANLKLIQRVAGMLFMLIGAATFIPTI